MAEEIKKDKGGRRGPIIGGMIVLVIGIIFLIGNLFPSYDFGKLWPLILIVIGLGILFGTSSKKE